MEQSKVTMKQELELVTNKMINGVEVNPQTKVSVQNSYIRMLEMKNKNGSLFQQITNSTNKMTTYLTIINNASAGLILGNDYYFVNYKNQIGEVKTGKGWKLLAEKFSTKPIDYIKVIVLNKKDKFKLIWDEDTDSFSLKDYEISLEKSIKYEDIVGTYGIVKFKDGTKRTRVIRKDELDKMKEVSPSKNSEYSPWNKWPERIVESKMYRDLVQREIPLDTNKMASSGYKMLEDDTPIKQYEIKDEKSNVVIVENVDYVVDLEKDLLTKVTNEIENQNIAVIERSKLLLNKKGIESIESLTEVELEYVLNGDDKNDK